jgi:hypothetical protein
VTDSNVVRPFVERVEGARVPWRARALDCFRAEPLLRVADPPLDEPFDDRAVERDFDRDASRRGDVLAWAMAFLL